MPSTERKIEIDKAFRRMASLCSRQEYCKADIRQKLKNINIPTCNLDSILNQLESEGFIDEKRYAYFFTNDKLKFNKWGKGKIFHALQQKQIPSLIIQKAMNKIDMEEYIKIITEELTKKHKEIKSNPSLQQKAKLFRFGSSRGYESDLVYEIMEKLVQS